MNARAELVTKTHSLKSPNWLFGQKKYEESGNAPKAAKSEIENGASQKEIDLDGYSELNCLSSVDINEEDIFQSCGSVSRYLAVTSVDEASGWYGDTLLGDQDEGNDSTAEADMEAALMDYDRIVADLGIVPLSCKSFAADPSWLTRWIVGEEKVEKV
ncbi:hypothetical protein OIU84_027156 [Salix udensis]|uniref:Uncharacterized protein n=1 Tax=Salix udensis TaxID=889485 RepID=A0AAD6KEQ2_9ROSI|nr:hypothetical protein OIU84_027156 [Salix udensis]